MKIAFTTLLALALASVPLAATAEEHSPSGQTHDESGHGGHGHGEEGDEHGDEHGDDHAGIVELEWAKAKSEGVEFQTAGSGEIRSALALHGEVSLNGDTVVHVSPRFPGVIKRVEKNLGDTVKAGELLAVVQSNESLTTYEILAEVPGTIIEKDATRGEFVRDDKQLFTIADLNTVWINSAVYPEEFSKVRVNAPVIIRSRTSDTQAKGTIAYIRPSLSETTRTALARIVLPNADRLWLPGMFVSVTVLITPEPAALTVPSSSVLLFENKKIVFIKTKSPDGAEAFARREVVAGKSDDERTEILSGLTAGEQVAAGNTYLLKAELGKGSAHHEH